MARVKRGEIYMINLPRIQGMRHCQYGYRPVLIYQCDNINKMGWETTVVIPISTCEYKGNEIDTKYHVLIKDVLKKDSIVKCENIRIIDKSAFRGLEPVAVLDNRGFEMSLIDNAVMRTLGLSNI